MAWFRLVQNLENDAVVARLLLLYHIPAKLLLFVVVPTVLTVVHGESNTFFVNEDPPLVPSPWVKKDYHPSYYSC